MGGLIKRYVYVTRGTRKGQLGSGKEERDNWVQEKKNGTVGFRKRRTGQLSLGKEESNSWV